MGGKGRGKGGEKGRGGRGEERRGKTSFFLMFVSLASLSRHLFQALTSLKRKNEKERERRERNKRKEKKPFLNCSDIGKEKLNLFLEQKSNITLEHTTKS